MLHGDDRVPGLIAGLREAGQTVAAAESLTGGLLIATLTAVPGASDVVRGGLVVYATDLKHSLAEVPQELLDARGPVDPDVAIALAIGARRVCGASVGLGLTGVAGPGAQHGHPPGTWFVALAAADGSVSVRSGAPPAAGSAAASALTRTDVRRRTVDAALDLLQASISGAAHPDQGTSHPYPALDE